MTILPKTPWGGSVALLAIAMVATACGPTSNDDPWGPLAVHEYPPNGDFARAEGTVRLTDECAMLDVPNGTRLLLVWSAEATRWEPESETIRYRGFDGEVVDVGDGQEVVLSGSGEPFVGPEAVVTMDEWVAARTWQAPPHESCVSDQSWSIGDLTLAGE